VIGGQLLGRHGATYEPTQTVKVGGFPAAQFDGQVVANKHVFVPFSPPTTGAASFPDAISVQGPYDHGRR
jgi:hypothetical protein